MEKSSAKDQLDERNYSYPKMGSEIKLPSKVLLDTKVVQNQYKDGYKMGCVYYSSSEASNFLNTKRTKGSELCDSSSTRSAEDGDWVINGAKHLIKLGIIKSYHQVNSLYDIKLSLYEKRPIHTGSQTIDWSTIKKPPFIAGGDSGSGHSFHIIGYDDKKEHLICKNSSGEENQDKGRFYIKYSEFNEKLFATRLSLIETEESLSFYIKKIMAEIKIESAKKFVERKYTNGERPQDNVTREEVWAMFERVLERNGLQ